MASSTCKLSLLVLAHSLVCSPAASSGRVSGHPDRFSFRGAGQVSEAEVNQAFIHELARDDTRLQALQEGLNEMYTSLPKNAHGNLGHQGVCYALHRYFLHHHGWFIRGLEPGNSSFTPPNGRVEKEWVPSVLQELLEKRKGDSGADLHDLAVLAASLEDLVRVETQARLDTAYQVHGLDSSSLLKRSDAEDVLSTYYISFLLGNNITVKASQIEAGKKVFAKEYVNYDSARAWFDGIVEHRASASGSGTGELDFQTSSAIALDIGEQYHTFNAKECSTLKSTLQSIEGRKPGRVRLSAFYNMSLSSHWRFTEKMEYLRAQGLLDESEPKAPAVIISNYVMSRANCLDGSHLYAICCRNECEDLLGHLERTLGAPAAPPSRVAELAAALPSASVPAPRVLPAALLGRLEEVAAQNGGQVRLHTRLFAQWMHHAYPMECPAPREPGMPNPQTPEEWMQETGQEGSQASEEEMKQLVTNDACAVSWEGKAECGEESDELPWSSVEQLLTSHAGHSAEGGCSVCRAAGFVFVLAAGTVALLVVLGVTRVPGLPERSAKKVAAAVCFFSAYTFGLIDLLVLIFSVSVGVVMHVGGTTVLDHAARRKQGGSLAKPGKTCLPL